ncbi:MAG: hypothetical protein ABUK01_02850 [Leptospirales bacterium]
MIKNSKNNSRLPGDFFDVERYSLYWLLFIICFIIFLRASTLFATEHAFGIDGYYYAAQIKSFWAKGRFFSPDSSIVLPAMAYFSRLGNDIVFMNKIFVLLLNALLLSGAYLAGSRINKFSGLLLAAYYGYSSLVTQFSFEFVKNFGALVFFIFYLAFLLKAEKRKRDYLFITAFLILGSLSHKLVAGISVLLAIVFLMHIVFTGHKERIVNFFKQRLWWVLGAMAFFVMGFAAAYIYLPNFIHLTDFERVGKALTFSPQAAPFSYLKLRGYDLVSVVDTGIMVFIIGIFFYKYVSRYRLQTKYKDKIKWDILILVSLCLLLVAWFPFLKFNRFDMAYRLFLLSFIPVGFLGLSSIVIIPRFRPFVLFGLLALGIWNNNKIASEKKAGIDYGTISQITPLINLPEDSLMIVHQGFDYYYCYAERKDAFHFLPEQKHEGRPIYRLAYGVSPEVYKKQLGKNASEIQYLPGFYTLLPEKLWNAFLESLPEKERGKYRTWRNPYTSREGFLRRNDKYLKKETTIYKEVKKTGK